MEESVLRTKLGTKRLLRLQAMSARLGTPAGVCGEGRGKSSTGSL